MLEFLFGLLFGIALTFLFLYVLLFNPFQNISTKPVFVEQFKPLQLPEELRRFLKAESRGGGPDRLESSFNLSLVLHFLFQEHKDTRVLRRWFHRKLQFELSDLTTRSAAGRLIQDVRVRGLSIGSKFPTIKSMCVESYQMEADNESFKALNLILDIDYAGGFEASVDVTIFFGRFAQMAIEVTRLSGKLRLMLSREPFTHWAVAFVEMPILELKVGSRWQGKQLKHVVPIITQQFRRILQRKHVWPNYKIRYRPFFPNPLFTPSPAQGSFDHIDIAGVLEATVLSCSRLNVSCVSEKPSEAFCTLCIDQRPLMPNASSSTSRCVTILLTYVHRGPHEAVGLSFSKQFSEVGIQAVQICAVEKGSSAEKSGFKSGDVVLAVNNLPVVNERQLLKLLCGDIGDLSVLVERTIHDEDESLFSVEADSGCTDEGFVTCFTDRDIKKLAQDESMSAQRTQDETGDGEVVIPGVKTIRTNYKILNVGQGSNPVLRSISAKSEEKRSLVSGTAVRRVRSQVELLTYDDCWTNRSLNRLFASSENLKPVVYTDERASLAMFAGTDRPSPPTSFNLNCQQEDGDNKDAEEIDVSNVLRKVASLSRRERIQAKAVEMAAAGRAKMSDLSYRRKDKINTEVAMDALLHPDNDLHVSSRSPSPRPEKDRAVNAVHYAKNRQIYCSHHIMTYSQLSRTDLRIFSICHVIC